MPNTFELISANTLASTTASVTFSSIPQTYTDLCIKASVRGLNSAVYQFASITFNGSTSGYSGKRIEGNGSSATSYGGSSTGVDINFGAGANATASTFGNAEVYIPNYTGSSYKSVSSDIVGENNATAAYSVLAADLWSNTAAITSITITGLSASFVANSTFYLYGVKNA